MRRQCSLCGQSGHFAKGCGRPRWPNGKLIDLRRRGRREVVVDMAARFYREWHVEAMGQPIEAFREWFDSFAGRAQFIDWHLAFRREGWDNKFADVDEREHPGKPRGRSAANRRTVVR